VLPTFLDNHDMNRFLWSAGGDVRRLRLAALMQLTLPRPPIIYYGTEVGLSQQTDVGGFGFAASRLPMPWGAFPRDDLHAYFQTLIHIRRDRASLRRGTRQTLIAIGGLYVFSMSTPDETTLVALNNSSESVVVRHDALLGRDLLVGGRLDGWLQLEPYTGTMIDTEAADRP
jgi:glycosidase